MESVPAPESMWITPESCTLLFGLRPVGANTLFVESLLSWLIRVAREHAVSPRDLVRELVGQHAPKAEMLCYASFFRRHAATVNGLGRYAELFVESLSALSGATGLENHTLRPWRFVIAGQGSPVLEPVPRWCPQCLADMVGDGIEPYRMLLWSLRAVEVCPFHKTVLHRRCPHCGVTQPAIPRWPDIVYCDSCRRSLLTNSSVPGTPPSGGAEGAMWRAYAAADLLRCNGALGGMQAPARLQWFLREIRMAVGQGNGAEVCRQAGLPPRALNKWLAGTDQPSLSSLFRLLYVLDYWPSEALAGEQQGSISPLAVSVSRSGRRASRRRSVKIGQTELLEAIRSASPPPLCVLARSLGMSRSGLKYRFPQECRSIVESRVAKRRAKTAAKRGDQEAAVREIMFRLARAGVFPGRKRVEAEARKLGFSLLSPNLRKVFQQGLMDRVV